MAAPSGAYSARCTSPAIRGNPKIRTVEVTEGTAGDAPMLPSLLSQSPESGQIASVDADSTCDGRACLDA